MLILGCFGEFEVRKVTAFEVTARPAAGYVHTVYPVLLASADFNEPCFLVSDGGRIWSDDKKWIDSCLVAWLVGFWLVDGFFVHMKPAIVRGLKARWHPQVTAFAP